MNLAYIISQYPAVSHTFIQREIIALRERGWNITTFSIRGPDPRELLTDTDRSEAHLTHVIVPPRLGVLFKAVIEPLFTTPVRFFSAFKCALQLRRPGLRGLLWSLFYFAEALLVHRVAQERRIAHFHAHFANVASDVALLAARLGGKNRATFSFTMHGPTEFFDIPGHRLAEKARAAQFIICISDFARSQLMPLIPEEQWSKLRVVHCGIDPHQFPVHVAASHRMRHRPVNILTVARLAPVKAHAVLFHALDELMIRGCEVRLTLAGDGPCRRELEALADTLGLRSHIEFLGNVGQDQVPQLLKDADLFVLPSFAEGVPVVLMEAMAARCPVIATRIAGIPELIEDGITGLLLPPGRADVLAGAIERLVAAPSFAERLAAAATQKIFRDFNLHLTSGQLDRIFRIYQGDPLEEVEPTPAPAIAVDARTRGRETLPGLNEPASDAADARSPKREPIP